MLAPRRAYITEQVSLHIYEDIMLGQIRKTRGFNEEVTNSTKSTAKADLRSVRENTLLCQRLLNMKLQFGEGERMELVLTAGRGFRSSTLWL